MGKKKYKIMRTTPKFHTLIKSGAAKRGIPMLKFQDEIVKKKKRKNGGSDFDVFDW